MSSSSETARALVFCLQTDHYGVSEPQPLPGTVFLGGFFLGGADINVPRDSNLQDSECFLPVVALQGQQSKQKLPQVRIPQPQEGMRMNRTSQNPLPC